MIGLWLVRQAWRKKILIIAFGLSVSAVSFAASDESEGVAANSAKPNHPSPYDTYQSIASNGETLVAVGSGRTLLKSTDAGTTWKSVSLPSYVGLIDVDACPDKTFLALDFYGRIWRGSAGGESWDQSVLPGEVTPMASTCTDSGDYWVVGSGSQYLRSVDRGSNWQVHDLDRDVILTEVEFTGGGNGYIFGEFGLALHTNDGGATWDELPELPKGFYVYDSLFQSSSRGLVAGRGGKVLFTQDGGESWTVDRAGGLPLYGLVADRDGHLFGVGEVGTVHRRHAPGNWQHIEDIRLNGFLRSGLFVNASKQGLIVVGGNTAKATPIKLEVH